MELVKYNGNLKSELFRFTTECFAELGKSFEPYGRHSFYNEIDNYFERFWCLVDEDKVKGTVAIARLDDITVELKALYLDSPLRGFGREYGRQILLWALVNINSKRIILRVAAWNKRAISLYEKNGFEIVGKA